MFAFVIVDFHLATTFVVRDRLGIKPMYYLYEKNKFAFSSELKSFYFLDDFSFQLNESQLHEYLLFRNNVFGTLLNGVQSLEPGHYLIYSIDNGLKKVSYFSINNLTRTSGPDKGIDYYKTKLLDSLSKSVERQLMSDVKVGCQLSGGTDSSLVAYLANKNGNENLFESVSIIFNDPGFSEEKYIDYVTQHLGIKSHKFLLHDNYYLKNFEKATWHFESPINHPNTIGVFLLAQRAKERVTVLLSGEGADEVFGGYRRFSNVCNPWQSKLILGYYKKNYSRRLRLFDYFRADNRAIMATSFLPIKTAMNLVGSFNFEKAIETRKSIYSNLNGSVFDKQVKYEIQAYLPDLLIRQDKMSMAHSIENRVPFLDNEVIECSFELPENLIISQKTNKQKIEGKYIVKLLTSDVFTFEFAFRDKMGFGIP